MLITQEYKALNSELHQTNEAYGASSVRWAKHIIELAEQLNTDDILDYGCGKALLSEAMPYLINNYDPAIEKYAAEPEPADIVVCTDVMEHIEPECLDNVLDHLQALTLELLFCSVATRPAIKTLADGRNAHLIVKNYEWWLPKFWQRFTINSFNWLGDGEFLITCRPKK